MFGGLFGGDDEDEGAVEESIDDERKKDIERILSRYDREFAEKLGGEGGPGEGRVASREYQEYQEAEEAHSRRNWYERFVNRLAFFQFEFDDLRKEHRNAIDLLNFDVETDQIAPAAVVASIPPLVAAAAVILYMDIPAVFKFGAAVTPFATFYYLLKYPSLKAKDRVVRSSEDLVLAVLYMVIYMRSSPNLEGAVSFAARHLSGPVASDFKRMLWKVDVRSKITMEEAIEEYMHVWKPYNRGFVESLNLIRSAMSEADEGRRNEILTEAIDRFLENTREKMDDFASQLKLPVMVFYGIGILLPVLGIILFPMIAAFMGGGGLVYYLVFLYNILLPAVSYAVMRNMLISRPISFTPQGLEKESGRFTLSFMGRKMSLSMFFLSVPLFLLMVAWPAPHVYQALVGGGSFPVAPSVITLLKEMTFVLALGIPAGIHLILGYRSTVAFQGTVRDMETEFPEVLYELSNQLNRGEPIEVAVGNVAGERQNLTISTMFSRISHNIRDAGMTFEEAVFDSEMGAVHHYPSDLISTVMEIIVESAGKGTGVTARALQSISSYLKDIHHTEERLEELLEDTTSSVKFLGFVLAPVIAGVAVGMGSVISLTFHEIGRVAGGVNQTANATQGAGGAGAGVPSIASIFNFGSAIPPGMLQLIVGIYVLQLSALIGTFLIRLEEGENPAKRNHTIGKLLITSLVFYTLVVLIIVTVFGGIIQGALQ